MSFPRYPEYKDSGVAWLGEVPAHWEVKRLKLNLRLITDKTDSRKNPLGLENIEGWTGRLIKTETEFEGDGISFQENDLLFGKLRPYLAKAYRAEAAGEAVGDFLVMRPSNVVDSQFIKYQFLSRELIDNIDGSTFGSKMPRASWDFIGNLKLALPPIVEQTAIARFLDDETCKTDELILEQERLIELLQEKRQAVIAHAVTKGLNADAPMKPSGVEWLGEVPAHWEIRQSRRLFLLRNERLRDSDKQLTASQKHGVIYQDEFMQLEGQRVVQVIKGADILKHVEPNDFVISMRSFQGGIEWCKYRGSISSAYVMLIPTEVVHAPFFAYLFKSQTYIQALQTTTNLVRDGQALRYDNFTQIPLPLMSVEEQRQIATFLDQKLAKIDELVNEAQKAIDLLQERRQALISAAVTGQIDVRQVQNESLGQVARHGND